MRATNETTNILKHRNAFKVILMLSVLVFLFYLFVNLLISDVYKNAIVGALFEILSIPMLLLLLILPILCIIQLIKSKGTARWYALASLALIIITVLILVQTSK